MYQLQDTPDEMVMLDNGELAEPVLTLRDEHGGEAHVLVDDHCYVLALGSEEEGRVKLVQHWFPEAFEAARVHLPPLTTG